MNRLCGFSPRSHHARVARSIETFPQRIVWTVRHFREPRLWEGMVGLLVGVLIVGPLGNRIWGWPQVWPWTLISLLLAVVMTGWRRHETKAAAQREATRSSIRVDQETRRRWQGQFRLCKPVYDLRPSDLGFQVTERGEAPDPVLRPFHSTYIPRTYTYLSHDGFNAANSVEDSDLIRVLRNGGSIALVGSPTEGKSRSLYNALSALPDRLVVHPLTDGPMPEEEAFTLMAGKSVILAIDDLERPAIG